MKLKSFCLYSAALLAFSSVPVFADAVFNFDNVAAGSVGPFTTTVNGLSASFSGPISVCNVTPAGFNNLSGNAAIQDLCNPPQLGPVTISFSSNLTNASFNFATAFSPSGSLTVQALENSSVVGNFTFTSSVPPGNFPNAEGTATISGLFNSLILTPSSVLALDNLSATTATASAVPEPATLSFFGAGGLLLAAASRRFRR